MANLGNRALLRRALSRPYIYRRILKAHTSKKKRLLLAYLFCALQNETQSSSLLRIVLPRPVFDVADHMKNIPGEQFRRLYRLTKTQFSLLADTLRPSLKRSQRHYSRASTALNVEIMLFVTLRILAGASYLDVGWPYGIASSTVYSLFEETLCALDMMLPEIQFPTTHAECTQRANMFCQLRRTPIFGIVAALDGIAIEITKPKRSDVKDPKKYFNRKGFFAVCVQAAAQADYKFCFVSATHSGGTHDSTAFASTKLYELLKGPRLPSWAVVAADDAYSNEYRVLTPYPGKGLSGLEDSFNAYLSSCRTIVEQAFGILVCRFGIFWSAIRYPLRKVTLIIMVACKLHNFILDVDDGTSFETIPSHVENSVHGSPIVHLQNNLHMESDNIRSRNRSRESSVMRDNIAVQLQRLGYVRRR